MGIARPPGLRLHLTPEKGGAQELRPSPESGAELGVGGGLWGQEGFPEEVIRGVGRQGGTRECGRRVEKGMPGLDMAKAKVPGPEWLVRLEWRSAHGEAGRARKTAPAC